MNPTHFGDWHIYFSSGLGGLRFHQPGYEGRGENQPPSGSESDRGILREILPPFKRERNLKLLESNVVVRIHLFSKKSDFESTKNQPLVVKC